MKNSTKSTIVNDIKQLNSYTLESMLDVFNTTERKLTEDELAFYAELYKELESRKEHPRFGHGGNIAEQNKEMLNNQAREVDHHIDELNNVLKNNVEVEPWVVAKMERATTDLSDITHYLDGEQKKEYSKPIYGEGGNVKIGDTIRLKNDLPYLASLDSLKGKDLKVKNVKNVYFASGSKLFYIVNHDGHEHEINEDFIEHKDKMATGGVIGKDITFNKWDETRNGTILELTDDGDYVVSSGAGSTLVSPEDVISFNEPKAKSKRFGFFENGGGVEGDAYRTVFTDEEGTDYRYFKDKQEALRDYDDVSGLDAQVAIQELIRGEYVTIEDNGSMSKQKELKYLELSDGKVTVSVYKINGKWYEKEVISGEKPYGWGNKNYMGYLQPSDIALYLSNDYKSNFQVVNSYKEGGGFDDDFVIFSVDDDALDTLLNDNHRSELDYEDIHGDSYYKLNKRDFDRFIDYADSIGFDVDYENNEDAVVYVVNPRMAHGGMTEHGLNRGDTIVFNSGDEVMVVDKKDEQHLVDLDKGMRYEDGGTIKIGDKVKASKEYGGKSGVVVDKIGSFVVVENSKGVSESYHESDLIKKMETGGDLTDEQVEYWLDYNENTYGSPEDSKKLYDFEDAFKKAISHVNKVYEIEASERDKKHIYELAKKFFNNKKWISVNIIDSMFFQESSDVEDYDKMGTGGGVGEQDKLETVLDNIFNGDYDEEEVDSLNVSQEMKDRINELSNLYSELNDAINDDDTKLENKLQKKVDKEYNYIIENAYKNKMANGGGVGKKEVAIGFGGLGNGTTVWDKNRIQNGDYKIIAHISDSGKITYHDKKLPQTAINKIEEFAAKQKKMSNGGGVKEQITGETIISKVGDRNEIKKYVQKDLGIEKGTELDKYIYFDDASFVFIDKTVCKIGGVNSNPNLKLKEVSKLMKKAILNAGYKLNDKMANGGSMTGWKHKK